MVTEKIRRGWYLGESNFRQRLEEHLGGVVKGKARQSFSGEAKGAHDEAAAEAMMVRGETWLGVSRVKWIHSLPREGTNGGGTKGAGLPQVQRHS